MQGKNKKYLIVEENFFCVYARDYIARQLYFFLNRRFED